MVIGDSHHLRDPEELLQSNGIEVLVLKAVVHMLDAEAGSKLSRETVGSDSLKMKEI